MTSDFLDLNEFKNMAEEDQVQNIRIMQTFTEIIEHKNKEIISSLSFVKSAYLAFEHFCEEVNISYNHIAKWLKITPIEELPVGVDKLSIVQSTCDSEQVKEITELLLSHWNKNS